MNKEGDLFGGPFWRLAIGMMALAPLAGASSLLTFAQINEISGSPYEFVNIQLSGTAVSAANNPCGVGVTACGILQTTTAGHAVTTNLVITSAAQIATKYHAPDSIPVTFSYENITGLPGGLTGVINAMSVVDIVTTEHAITFGSHLYQQFNMGGTITYLADAAPLSGYPTLTDLLSVTIGNTPDGLSGSVPVAFGSDTASGDVLSFVSDFLSFPAPLEDTGSITFSSYFPCYSLKTNNACTTGVGVFLHSFDGAAQTEFASNPVPRYTYGTPEPLSMSLVGLGLVGLSFAARRKKRT